jgi:hypothetical protein
MTNPTVVATRAQTIADASAMTTMTNTSSTRNSARRTTSLLTLHWHVHVMPVIGVLRTHTSRRHPGRARLLGLVFAVGGTDQPRLLFSDRSGSETGVLTPLMIRT